MVEWPNLLTFIKDKNNKTTYKMTKRQEVLTTLAKQILDKKSLVEFIKNKEEISPMDEITIADVKDEIRILLNAIDLIIE